MDLAELRLRLALRRLRTRGGAVEAIARAALLLAALAVGAAGALALAAGSLHAARARDAPTEALRVVVAGALFGLWQTWTVVGLLFQERDALDLRRLLQYPVPPARLYATSLAAGLVADPYTVVWFLPLGGAVAGAWLGRPGAWVALLAAVLAGFAAATVGLVTLLQELLARLTRRRRWRELALVAAMVAWLLAAAAGTQARAGGPLGLVRHACWVAYPAALAGEAAGALYVGRPLEALGWLAALAAAAALSAWCAYRVALATARAAGGEAARPAAARPGAARRALLPALVGPLLEKELRYLARHPAARMLLVLVPVLAAFAAWQAPRGGPGPAGEAMRGLPLAVIAAYAQLALQGFWVNGFGWDRGGARTLFLAPIAPERILAAKNVAALAWAVLVFALAAGAWVAVAGPPPGWSALAAATLVVGLAPVLYGLGNVLGAVAPWAASFGVQRAGAMSGVAALASTAIAAAAVGLYAVPAAVALALGAAWAVPIAWAALAAAAVAAWWLTLPAAGRLLVRRRERILAAVCGEER